MLTFALDGLNGLYKSLDAMDPAIKPGQILDEAGALLLSRIRQRFLAEVDPNGKPWFPSNAAIWRKKRGYGGGTLFDTGRLFHSIQLHKVGDDREISTDVPYAPDHNFGIGQVLRPFMGYSAEDVDLMERLIVLRIQQALGVPA